MFRYVAFSVLLPLSLVANPAHLFADDAEAVIELVPDNPGPYVGGETVQIEVWIHSLVNFDAQFDWVQFDCSDTDPDIGLPATFSFDYALLREPHFYEEGHVSNGSRQFGQPPALPIPFTYNGIAFTCYPCPETFFVLPPGSSYHVGSFAIVLPSQRGTYSLDVLNADATDDMEGAIFNIQDGPTFPDEWRAKTGELIGGLRVFVVTGPIPAVSTAGLLALAAGIAALGIVVIRGRAVPLTAILIPNTSPQVWATAPPELPSSISMA